MPRPVLAFAAALAVSSITAWAQTAPRGDAQKGRKVYVSYGCYQCHGYQGQGSNAGPRLAPNPFPYAAFLNQLRQPRARMPAYTVNTASNQALADIYAYLLTFPNPPKVADIPLLAEAPQ
jgi:mono/diheme cytochrome c family protein